MFKHGRLRAGQRVIAHGAAGAVGSTVTQLARLAGAHVIGTGRAADLKKALTFGAQEFVSLENDDWKTSAASIRCPISSAVTSGSNPRACFEPEERWRPSSGPSEVRPACAGWTITHEHRQHRYLDDDVAALNPTERIIGKTNIRVRL